jgi:putative ABC transport system permease protein
MNRSGLVVWWFDQLCRLMLPATFHGRYGRALVDAFTDGLSAQPSRWRRLRYAARELRALLMTALSEWRRLSGAEAATTEHHGGFMYDLGRDIVHAFRLTVRNPQYSTMIVVTLALGIGGNAAVFTFVDAVLFRPLPFERSDRLVQVWNRMSTPVNREMTVAPADFMDLAARSRTIADLAAHNVWFPTVGDASGAERVNAGVVTANLFPLLGVKPILGRNFSAGEDATSGDRLLILSHGAWLRRFAGSRAAIGQTLLISGVPYQIIGVMPPEYRHPDPHEPLHEAEFFAPISYTAASASRESQFLRVVGRLADGATIEQSRAELEGIARQLAAEYPATNRDRAIHLIGLRENFFGALRRPLLIAQAAALLVLLIACANIGNLVLVRGHSRRREFAVRVSLGAQRFRLARQLVVETLVLSLLGSVLALVCLAAGMGALRSLEGRFIPAIADFAFDGTVILFTIALAMLTGLVFGLVPLLELQRGDLRGILAEETAGAGRSRRAQRLQHTLVAAEVALALGLVVGTGVLARSLIAMRQVSPGFSTDDVLTFEVVLPAISYSDTARTRTFFRELEPRLAALPGASAAALISDLPLTSENRSLGVRPAERPPESEVDTNFQVVSASYFATLDIPVLRGRAFTAQDGGNVAVIGESLARQFWPGQDAIGKRLIVQRGEPVLVVGVVGDVIDQNLTAGTKAMLYLPPPAQRLRRMAVVLRTTVPPLSLATAARNVVREMDATVPVVDVRTMRDIVDQHLGQPRFTASLSTLFSALALALAVLGVYGVLAYAVSTRTREIGIRAALGADHAAVGRMIVRQAMRLVLPGLVIGALLGTAITRVLSSYLFGVGSLDFISFATAGAILIAAALLASWIPARRAAAISPMRAILQ